MDGTLATAESSAAPPEPVSRSGVVERLNQIVTGAVDLRFRAARDTQRPFLKLWNEIEILAAGLDSRRTDAGRNRRRLPYLERGIRAIANRLTRAVFPDPRIINCMSRNPAGASNADAMTKILRFAAEDTGQRLTIKRLITDALNFGYCVAENCFEEHVEKRVERTRIDLQIVDVATGQIRRRRVDRPITVDRLTSSRPLMVRRNPRQVFPSNIWGTLHIDDCAYVCQQYVLPWSELYARRERFVEIEENGETIEMVTGLFRNIPKIEEQRPVPYHGNREDMDQGSTVDLSQEGNTSGLVDGFVCNEVIFRDFDLGKIIRDATSQISADGLLLSEGLQMWLDDWGLTVSDLAPCTGRWRIRYLDESRVPIEITRNPMPRDRSPLRSALIEPRFRDCLIGLSLWELMGTVQSDLDYVAEGTIDAARRISKPWYTVPRSIVEAGTTSLQQLANARPGEVIAIDVGVTGDGSSALTPQSPPYQVVEQGMRVAEFLRSSTLQTLNAPNDIGSQIGERASATEVSSVEANANEGLEENAQTISESLLVPSWNDHAALAEAFIVTPQAIVVRDPVTGQRSTEIVTPEEIRGDFEVRSLDNHTVLTRMQQVQNVMELVRYFDEMATRHGQPSPFIFTSMVREIFRMARLAMDPDMILKTDEQLALEAIRLAEQAAQAQQAPEQRGIAPAAGPGGGPGIAGPEAQMAGSMVA